MTCYSHYNHYKVFFLVLGAFLVLFSGCEPKINTSWHKFSSRECQLSGNHSGDVEVISDRWRIIGIKDKSNDLYEWEWEITIRVPINQEIVKSLHKYQGAYLLGIKKIKYSLFDNANAELVDDTLSHDVWGRIIPIDGGKNIIAQEYGTTKTYKQASTLSKSQAVKAISSCYHVIVD
jgi:hypothetical protein